MLTTSYLVVNAATGATLCHARSRAEARRLADLSTRYWRNHAIRDFYGVRVEITGHA
jgi:hypothetical protein